MRHLFIINPKSFLPDLRKMDLFISEVNDFFKGKYGQCTIHVSRFPRDAIIVMRRYFKKAPSEPVRVYAVGGDGVAFCCLNGIIGIPDAELALMPFGTGNNFVRGFGLKHYNEFRNLGEQAAAPVIPVDVIKCNGNYALNFCTVGTESAAIIKILPLLERFERLRRRFQIFNRLFYMIGALHAPFDKRVMGQKYEISADGENFSAVYNSINIANGPYYGLGMTANPSAVPDDGLLDMLITKKTNAFLTLAGTVPFLAGHWRLVPASFIFRRVKKVSIRSSKPLFVNLDGEIFFDTNLDIEIIPALVNVVSVTGEGFKQVDKSLGDSMESAAL
jgi:diacylglycerol kinase family enzyme